MDRMALFVNVVQNLENDVWFSGHFAPVTGIDCHRAVGNVDFTQLFLTSSFDWTVKLWSTKVKGQRRVHPYRLIFTVQIFPQGNTEDTVIRTFQLT